MQHNKFQAHKTLGSTKDFLKNFTIYGHGGYPGEEDFKSFFFTIYGCGGNFDHVTWTIYINFHSSSPLRLHMKFGFD